MENYSKRTVKADTDSTDLSSCLLKYYKYRIINIYYIFIYVYGDFPLFI